MSNGELKSDGFKIDRNTVFSLVNVPDLLETSLIRRK